VIPSGWERASTLNVLIRKLSAEYLEPTALEVFARKSEQAREIVRSEVLREEIFEAEEDQVFLARIEQLLQQPLPKEDPPAPSMLKATEPKVALLAVPVITLSPSKSSSGSNSQVLGDFFNTLLQKRNTKPPQGKVNGNPRLNVTLPPLPVAITMDENCNKKPDPAIHIKTREPDSTPDTEIHVKTEANLTPNPAIQIKTGPDSMP
jgi:hypothetical protein